MYTLQKATVEIVESGMEFRVIDEISFGSLQEATTFVAEENRLLEGTLQSARIKAGCEPDAFKKRLRQVRDALNKTKDSDVVEQIAALLRI